MAFTNDIIYRIYLESLLKTLNNIYIFLSPQEVITELSPIVETYYSWQLNEVRGKSFESLYQLPNCIMPFSLVEYKKLIKTKESVHSIVEKSDEKIYLAWSIIPITGDLGHILIANNITPMKKLDIDHRTFSSQIEKIAACVPGNFYWKNKNAQYLGCNETLLKTLGLTSVTEIIGKTDKDLWPEYAETLKEND